MWQRPYLLGGALYTIFFPLFSILSKDLFYFQVRVYVRTRVHVYVSVCVYKYMTTSVGAQRDQGCLKTPPPGAVVRGSHELPVAMIRIS